MSTALYDPIKTQATITDSTVVLFSGGKDSAVALDLCFKYFKKVVPVFMFIVKDLEFQEITLRWYEDRYNIEILRVPHFMLSDFLRYGSFRIMDLDVPVIKTIDLYNYIREVTGVYWISGGERIADSIFRRAMIKKSSSIDKERGKFYPLAYWNKAQVMSYVKHKKLPLSLESRALGFSFRSLYGDELKTIKGKFPNDFEKIKNDFPLVEASIKWSEIHGS